MEEDRFLKRTREEPAAAAAVNDWLPPLQDLVVHILPAIDVDDKKALRLVSNDMCTAVSSLCRSMAPWQLQGLCERFPYTEQLSFLIREPWGDQQEEPELVRVRISEEEQQFLGRMTALTHLCLSNVDSAVNLTSTLHHLAQSPVKLKSLSLTACKADAQTLQQLTEFTSLRKLSLTQAMDHPSTPNPLGLYTLERLTSGLLQLTQVTSLSLDILGASATSLGDLPKLTALTHLELYPTIFNPNHFAHSELTQLSTLSNLVNLSMTHEPLPAALISRLTRLTNLDFRYSSPDQLTSCQQLTELRSLHISRIIDVASLQLLEALPSTLTSLHLDLGLELIRTFTLHPLTSLTHLQSLSLHDIPCRPCSHVLEPLSALTYLTRLHLFFIDTSPTRVDLPPLPALLAPLLPSLLTFHTNHPSVNAALLTAPPLASSSNPPALSHLNLSSAPQRSDLLRISILPSLSSFPSLLTLHLPNLGELLGALDLTPLLTLTRIQTLSIEGQAASDLVPLTRLTTLRSLKLTVCQVPAALCTPLVRLSALHLHNCALQAHFFQALPPSLRTLSSILSEVEALQPHAQRSICPAPNMKQLLSIVAQLLPVPQPSSVPHWFVRSIEPEDLSLSHLTSLTGLDLRSRDLILGGHVARVADARNLICLQLQGRCMQLLDDLQQLRRLPLLRLVKIKFDALLHSPGYDFRQLHLTLPGVQVTAQCHTFGSVDGGGAAQGLWHGGALGPQHGGPLGPQHAGALGQQHAGLLGPQHAGALGPQHAGALGPQHAGLLGPQHAGALGPQHAGLLGPQHAGLLGPQHAGLLGPQHAEALGPQHAEALGPQHAEALGPQQEGPQGLQQAGPEYEGPAAGA